MRLNVVVLVFVCLSLVVIGIAAAPVQDCVWVGPGRRRNQPRDPDPVKRDIVRTALGRKPEHGGIRKRPQHHRARAGLRRFRRGGEPAATRQRGEAEQSCGACRSYRLHRVLWVPSQNGLPPVALPPQSHTSSLALAVNGTGVNPVPWCEPSQNG